MMSRSIKAQLAPKILLLLQMLGVALPVLGQRTRVETDDAIYIGRTLSLSSPSLLQTIGHFGIPYAEPPVGLLRFAPPVPWQPAPTPSPGNNTDGLGKPELNATHPGPACMQRPDPIGTPSKMSEDCLYLSIQSPNRDVPPDGFPVLVWLHGGYFETGGVSQPDVAFAWDLVSGRNLLVAEVAYRLGVFGFLSLTNGSANVGLLDQQLALAWISKNIDFFGGTNASVTLAGLDAGAASVGFHLLSPGSRSLFQQCAFFGGSPLTGWALVRDRAALASLHRDFYRNAGCPDGAEAAQILDCLRKLTAGALNAHQAEFNRAFERVEFPAVVDGRFLTADPLDSFANARFESKPALIGTTSLEGIQLAYRSLNALNISEISKLVGEAHRQLLNEQFKYLPRFPEQPSPLARNFLLSQLTAYESEATGAANFDLLTRALTQLVTVCSSNRFTDQLSSRNPSVPVFSYLFAEPDPNSVDYKGAGHGSDAAYFFGEPLRRADYDSEQQELSRQMMIQLSEFLASGNLSKSGWHPTQRPSLQFYRLLAFRSGGGGAPSILRGGYERQECRLWDELLPWLSESGRLGSTTTTEPAGIAEARFWERCNATFNTVSVVAIVIGGSLVLLLLIAVVLVAKGRRGSSSHDSIELNQISGSNQKLK